MYRDDLAGVRRELGELPAALARHRFARDLDPICPGARKKLRRSDSIRRCLT